MGTPPSMFIGHQLHHYHLYTYHGPTKCQQVYHIIGGSVCEYPTYQHWEANVSQASPQVQQNHGSSCDCYILVRPGQTPRPERACDYTGEAGEQPQVGLVLGSMGG